MNTNPPSPWVPDADPVETAAAVARTMDRLVAETAALTDLDQAPMITAELLVVLRKVADVSSHLSQLSFEHPTPAPSAGRGPDAFQDRWTRTRAVNGFNDAAARIFLACQPLATARNAITGLLDQTPPDSPPSGMTAAAADEAPDRPGDAPDRPHRPDPHRSEPAHTPVL